MADGFGCARCYGDDAAVRAFYGPGFEIVAFIVDEFHFIVSLRRCPACGPGRRLPPEPITA
jgi:hypothetical protein